MVIPLRPRSRSTAANRRTATCFCVRTWACHPGSPGSPSTVGSSARYNKLLGRITNGLHSARALVRALIAIGRAAPTSRWHTSLRELRFRAA